VLNEKKFDETVAGLEYSPHRSLTRLAKQAQVSTTMAWKASKSVCLQQYKIRHIQAPETGDYKRRMHFCNWFLLAVQIFCMMSLFLMNTMKFELNFI
jgi:hypothetical protein